MLEQFVEEGAVGQFGQRVVVGAVMNLRHQVRSLHDGFADRFGFVELYPRRGERLAVAQGKCRIVEVFDRRQHAAGDQRSQPAAGNDEEQRSQSDAGEQADHLGLDQRLGGAGGDAPVPARRTGVCRGYLGTVLGRCRQGAVHVVL